MNIFDLNSRLKLERQGLSSGRRRRKLPETGLLVTLEDAVWARISLFILFAIGVILFIFLARPDDAVLRAERFRLALVIGSLVAILMIHLQAIHGASFRSNRRVFLLLAAVFVNITLAKLAMVPVQPGILPEKFGAVLPAYALAPMAISILLGTGHGIFVALYASLLGALVVPGDRAIGFLLVSLISGFAAVHLTRQVRRRGSLVLAGLSVGLVTGFLTFATGQVVFDASGWRGVVEQLSTAALVGLATSMIVGGALPFLESWFQITTVFSWLEYSDLNHPLLRRLNFEAPGTHHHSMMVAQLAERAAETIGANAAMCRAAAYFHDVGKLSKPHYFIENIGSMENPHDDLTPTMSALILAAHVKDGVDLALKHGLNKDIINIIREHHGTSVIQFFYRRALDQRSKTEALVAEGKASAEDLPTVQEKDFRYPGPKPRTRESAIISLADCIESASRSMAKVTPHKLEQLIADLTEMKLADGQFDDCDLTLGELTKIRKSLHSTLLGMLHTRIAYPAEALSKRKRSDVDRPRDKSSAGARGNTARSPTTPSAAAPARKAAAEGETVGKASIVDGVSSPPPADRGGPLLPTPTESAAP